MTAVVDVGVEKDMVESETVGAAVREVMLSSLITHSSSGVITSVSGRDRRGVFGLFQVHEVLNTYGQISEPRLLPCESIS